MEKTHFEALYPEKTRFKEIQSILTYIKNGKSSEAIGIPGVGRSNLLGLLAYNRTVKELHLGKNTKWFHFVYMDFSEVKNRSLFDTNKFMLISLAYSLLERGMQDEYSVVNGYIKEAIDFNDELILFQALKKTIDYLAIEKELTIVFLFDRFDQYIQTITETFFQNLKILRNRAKYRFSCIFSLARPLEDTIEPVVLSEFYEFVIGNNVYLEINDPVGLEFRLSYIQKVTGKSLPESLKKELIQLTGGHGKLVKAGYEALLTIASGQVVNPRQRARMTEKELTNFLLEQKTIKGALWEIWNSLLPVEQILLESGIKNQESETYSYLEHIGIIHKGKISIPLLENYIAKLPKQKTDTVIYNPDTNDIVKNNEVITDKLSPSEFRLLRFLIQNKDRICEKDEVITAVWKDSKTQEGVTDQALDQIIYRLRKKIEEDPNNPTHLQTIKGRGFRFLP